MKLTEALAIVIELASQNMIDEQEVHQDPEILGPERERQQKALRLVQHAHTALNYYTSEGGDA